MVKNCRNARNFSQCDSLLLGDKCGAHTFPYLEVENPTAQVEHEATTSKIGEDQIFYPAFGRVMRGYDRIEVTCPAEVKTPVAVRYAFGNYVPGVLKNGRGVAVAPFRTDNWPEKK